jgi:hypothetical protein
MPLAKEKKAKTKEDFKESDKKSRWLMNDFDDYVRRSRKGNCPATMEKYISSRFSGEKLTSLLAQLFWETYVLRGCTIENQLTIQQLLERDL